MLVACRKNEWQLLTFLELLRSSLDARLKDLSICRTVESQAEPFATRPPVMECRSSFNIEQIIGDGAVQHDLHQRHIL